MNPPENKNGALEKFLELNHPQTWPLLKKAQGDTYQGSVEWKQRGLA